MTGLKPWIANPPLVMSDPKTTNTPKAFPFATQFPQAQGVVVPDATEGLNLKSPGGYSNNVATKKAGVGEPVNQFISPAAPPSTRFSSNSAIIPDDLRQRPASLTGKKGRAGNKSGPTPLSRRSRTTIDPKP